MAKLSEMTKLNEMTVDELRAHLYLQTRDPIWLRGNAQRVTPENQPVPMGMGARYAQDPGNSVAARQFPNDAQIPGRAMSPRPAQYPGGYDRNFEGGSAKANQGRTDPREVDLVGLRAQLYLQTRDPIWLRGNARQPAPKGPAPADIAVRYAQDTNTAAAQQIPDYGRTPQVAAH